MLTKTKLTYSRYRELPENDPYEHEMIHGEEFVAPSPMFRHQWIVDRLVRLMANFVEERQLGSVVAPVDLYYGEEDYVSPDISFFTVEQTRQLMGEQKILLAPPLVVEVLSKSSIKWDREDKRGFYSRLGVREYWILDPFDDSIEVVDLERDVLTRADPAVSIVLQGFSVSCAQLFSA